MFALRLLKLNYNNMGDTIALKRIARTIVQFATFGERTENHVQRIAPPILLLRWIHFPRSGYAQTPNGVLVTEWDARQQ